MLEIIPTLYKQFLKNPLVCTDTRKIVPGAMFFGLKGENFDGNLFVEQALNQGCSLAIADNPDLPKNDKVIRVDNALKTLQHLAAFHRMQLNIPFIGITGTNGKTSTKELINNILSKKYKVCATQGNLNNHIGVPLSVLSVTPGCEIAVIEMGANHPGEIHDLCMISQPDYGIITNIGKAHLEGFQSINGIINTKKAIYDTIKSRNGKIFVCHDNSLLMDLSAKLKRITYGTNPESDCRAEIISSNPLLNLKWIINKNQTLNINTKLAGYYNFENVLSAICIGQYFNIKPLDIKDAIEDYSPSNNRSQVLQGKKNTIIMDAYNANPASMDAALRNFIQCDCSPKFAVIGDMLELGDEAENEHKKIIGLLATSGIDKVILVGENFHSLKNLFQYPVFTEVGEASAWLEKSAFNGFTFFIKGSRGIKLENVLPYI